MPKVIYELSSELNLNPNYEKGEFKIDAVVRDGKVIIQAEYDYDDPDLLESADAAGDEQSNMLWDIFDHNFTVYDEDNNPVEYD